MNSKTFKIISIFIVFFLFNAISVSAKTLIVSNNGPFHTIQKALDSMESGDIVEIDGGVYFENLILKDFGKDKLWSAIRAKNSENVIIDGSKNEEAAFYIENTKYLKIDGLHFRNAKKYGVALFYSSYIIVSNCQASYNIWEGFLSKHSNHTDFINCIGHDNVHDSFNFNDVKNSKMINCLQYRGGNGLSIERGSENISVEDNIFYNNWTDGILVYIGCKNITIKNNIIYSVDFKNPLDNGQGHCIKITHKNENVQVINNKFAQCEAAFSYEIAENKRITYSYNQIMNIGRRIPIKPNYSWKGDVLYKGPGDYPKFSGCAWYNLEDIEKRGWGIGNYYNENLIAELEKKIVELKNSGLIIQKNENTSNK